MGGELSSGLVSCGEISIHHTFGGRGKPPLLMIHGLGSSGYMEWRYNLPALARGRAIYAPDLPGFGRSDKPPVRYDIGFFTRLVERYMREVGLQSVAVLGTSLGGRIAIELAIRQPRRVSRLVLVDCLGLGRPKLRAYYPLLMLPAVGESVLRGVGRAMASASNTSIRRSLKRFTPGVAERALDDPYLDEMRAAFHDAGYNHAYLSTVRSLARRHTLRGAGDLVARLGRLDMPIQLIWGSDDPLLPVAHGMEAHRSLPGSRLAIIQGVGHTPQAEEPEQFNRIVDGFLTSRDG